MVNDYLRFRKQRKKIGSSYSDWANVTRGISQRSILESLLFIIFINDIFLFTEKSDICKFADNNTLFSYGDNLSVILKSLEHNMKILLRWFKFTYSESRKVSIYDSSEALWSRYCFTIGSTNVKEWDLEEVLGITIVKHLDFKKHIENLC